MHLVDLWAGLRRRKPVGGGDGRCRTRSGELVDLELYKFDSCPYCQVAMRTIGRLGLPVRYRDILADDEAARRLVEVGGRDQVPCLFVDGRPLYESADIVRFLEERFGSSRP